MARDYQVCYSHICALLWTDGGTNTELIDPSDAVTEAEVAGLTERCTEAMGGYGVVALCGTQPPGAEGL